MACSQNPNLRLSTPRRIIIYILGLLDSILFGGAVFGWPQLVYILKTDNVFSDLCMENNKNNSFINRTLTTVDGSKSDQSIFSIQERCLTGSNLSLQDKGDTQIQCAAQDERFALLFTLGVLFYGVPGIAIGFMLHYVGLRTTRMLGSFMIACSFLCLSATTEETSNWLFPTVILLALGGNTLRLSGMQLGDLFPKHRSTAITLLSGVYAASASLFLTFSIMDKVGVSRAHVSYFFAALSGVLALCSLVMPLHHIPYGDKVSESEKVCRSDTFQTSSITLSSSMTSLSSLLHLYWFFIALFTINIYQQTYNIWVTASSCTMEEAGMYSNWFSYSNLVSVFIAPFGGFFTDRMVRRARKGSLSQLQFFIKEIQANFVPLFITTVLNVVMYGCLLFFHPVAIVVSLMCMIVVRPCTIAISTAYLRIRFPAEHFNRLLGIYSTVSSFLLFFQYPHFQLAQDMYYVTHAVTLVLLILSLFNPLHLLWSPYLKAAVQERNNNTAQEPETENLKMAPNNSEKTLPYDSSS